MAEWEAKRGQASASTWSYGLSGLRPLAKKKRNWRIGGGYRAMLMSSGLAAISAPLQAASAKATIC